MDEINCQRLRLTDKQPLVRKIAFVGSWLTPDNVTLNNGKGLSLL